MLTNNLVHLISNPAQLKRAKDYSEEQIENREKKLNQENENTRKKLILSGLIKTPKYIFHN